jgi:aminoglycoside 3-N-acetyltransferase I
MPVPCVIERLTSEQLGSLRALNALFADAFHERDTYLGRPPEDAYLVRLLAKEHVIVLIARVAGEVAGGLVAYELDKFEQQRREIYIYDLAVAAAQRRQGLATALIERLRAIAAARGAWALYVQADYADAPAIALYQKFGVREAVLHFDIAPAASRP